MATWRQCEAYQYRAISIHQSTMHCCFHADLCALFQLVKKKRKRTFDCIQVWNGNVHIWLVCSCNGLCCYVGTIYLYSQGCDRLAVANICHLHDQRNIFKPHGPLVCIEASTSKAHCLNDGRMVPVDLYRWQGCRSNDWILG